MRPLDEFNDILLYTGHVDFRKWIRGLVSIVETELGKDPCANTLFVFVSKDRRSIKFLYWDKCGFAVWMKRLEKEKFPKPVAGTNVLKIDSTLFKIFMQGGNIFKISQHKSVHFSRYS